MVSEARPRPSRRALEQQEQRREETRLDPAQEVRRPVPDGPLRRQPAPPAPRHSRSNFADSCQYLQAGNYADLPPTLATPTCPRGSQTQGEGRSAPAPRRGRGAVRDDRLPPGGPSRAKPPSPVPAPPARSPGTQTRVSPGPQHYPPARARPRPRAGVPGLPAQAAPLAALRQPRGTRARRPRLRRPRHPWRGRPGGGQSEGAGREEGRLHHPLAPAHAPAGPARSPRRPPEGAPGPPAPNPICCSPSDPRPWDRA